MGTIHEIKRCQKMSWHCPLNNSWDIIPVLSYSFCIKVFPSLPCIQSAIVLPGYFFHHLMQEWTSLLAQRPSSQTQHRSSVPCLPAASADLRGLFLTLPCLVWLCLTLSDTDTCTRNYCAVHKPIKDLCLDRYRYFFLLVPSLNSI